MAIARESCEASGSIAHMSCVHSDRLNVVRKSDSVPGLTVASSRSTTKRAVTLHFRKKRKSKAKEETGSLLRDYIAGRALYYTFNSSSDASIDNNASLATFFPIIFGMLACPFRCFRSCSFTSFRPTNNIDNPHHETKNTSDNTKQQQRR
jgi:hypothetical protein